MKKIQIHVTPDGRGGWNVESADPKKVLGRYIDKPSAIVRAKALAKEATLAQVVIHNKRGVVQSEFTYGQTPKRFKG